MRNLSAAAPPEPEIGTEPELAEIRIDDCDAASLVRFLEALIEGDA